MTHQIPKASHPWRQYANRPRGKKQKKTAKPLRRFLREVVVSWDNVEITTSSYTGVGRYNLTELSDKKVAAWLMGILRRNYA